MFDNEFLDYLKANHPEAYTDYMNHLMLEQKYYEFGVPINYTEADGKITPMFAEVYTFDDFLIAVKDGLFIDSDGTGYLAKENAEGQLTDYFSIFCDMDWLNRNRHDFTHICWYNK